MISSNYEYWKSYLIPLVIYFLSSVLIKFRLGKIFITSIETLLKDQLLWIINGGTNTQYFNVETGARKDSHSHSDSHSNEEDNDVFILNERIMDNFVSKNVVNLSKWKLTKAKISLLSKRLKLVPTSNHISKAKLKMEL